MSLGSHHVIERWSTQDAVQAFRGAGVPSEQEASIRSASVSEFDVTTERRLT